MMKGRQFIYLSFLFLCAPLLLSGQTHDLSIFQPLVGKKWKAEQKWETGGKFKQEVEVSYALDKKLVLVKSKGYTNQEQTTYGMRNIGIRQMDAKEGKVKFWEYDVFGGVTQGTVFGQGKNLYYQYDYDGAFLTDEWEYVNDSTYNYKVGFWETGQWKKVFLETQFKAQAVTNQPISMSELAEKLNGKWSAKAWGGILEENWELGEDGYLHQSAQSE